MVDFMEEMKSKGHACQVNLLFWLPFANNLKKSFDIHKYGK